MFEPTFLIRLDKKAFPHNQVVCLGSQLKSIVKNLSELIEPHIWFGADVDAISSMPKKLGVDSFQLRKIGDSHSLINVCECQKQLRINNEVINLGVSKSVSPFQLVKALEIKLANNFLDIYLNDYKTIDVLIIETQYEKFKLNCRLMTVIQTFLFTRSVRR